MMKLLTRTQQTELPEEALLARLRCRRAALDLSASHTAAAPAGEVTRWVYQRLNRRLRRRLEPFLNLLAMRHLTLILRYSLAGELPQASLLSESLLAEELQQLVTTTDKAEAIVAKLEAALISDYPFVDGLTATYRNQGPGGVEQQLSSGILQHGLSRPGHKIVIRTLRYLVDMRNCLTISKLWRWQVKQAPTLLSGGQLATPNLHRLWATHDSERLSRLAVQLAGEPLRNAKTFSMEQCLLKGLKRLLHKAGRDPLGLAVIVEYLWMAQLASHNQRLQQALAVGREELLEEVLLL